MAPAHQRFETGELHVGEARDRLVDDLDLVALDGAAQILLESKQLRTVVAHAGAEKFDRVLAPALCLVESDLGVLDEFLAARTIIEETRNAKACGEEQIRGRAI